MSDNHVCILPVRVGLVSSTPALMISSHSNHELLSDNVRDLDTNGSLNVQIQAHYQTEWGEHKKSLLLTAGWYSPHFQLLLCSRSLKSFEMNKKNSCSGHSDSLCTFLFAHIPLLLTGGALQGIFIMLQRLVLPSSGPYQLFLNM